MTNKTTIFEDIDLSDVFKEIWERSSEKKAEITGIIEDMMDVLKKEAKIDSILMIAPIIKDFLDVGIKNDEQLVKLAKAVQLITPRIGDNPNSGVGISEDEKQAIYRKAQEGADALNEMVQTAKEGLNNIGSELKGKNEA